MIMQTLFSQEAYKYRREVQIECYWECSFLVGDGLGCVLVPRILRTGGPRQVGARR